MDPWQAEAEHAAWLHNQTFDDLVRMLFVAQRIEQDVILNEFYERCNPDRGFCYREHCPSCQTVTH